MRDVSGNSFTNGACSAGRPAIASSGAYSECGRAAYGPLTAALKYSVPSLLHKLLVGLRWVLVNDRRRKLLVVRIEKYLAAQLGNLLPIPLPPYADSLGRRKKQQEIVFRLAPSISI